MSLLRYLTPRNLLSFIHLIVGILIFACGVVSAVWAQDESYEQWIYLVITLFIIGAFIITSQLYGHRYFAQAGFMYTFGGRGVFYAFLSTLLLAFGDNFVNVVGVICLILAIINVAVAFFCTRGEIPSIDLPLPFFGPAEFANIHSRLDPSLSSSHVPLARHSAPPGESSSEVFSLEAK